MDSSFQFLMILFYSESVVTAYLLLLVKSEANVNTVMKPKRAIKDSMHGKKKRNAQSKDRAQHKYCKITDCPSQKQNTYGIFCFESFDRTGGGMEHPSH
jgi:hypothetical protein